MVFRFTQKRCQYELSYNWRNSADLYKETASSTTTELSVNQSSLSDNLTFEANTIGMAAYFNVGEIISCRANYTRPHKLTTASLSIVYYGT